MRFDNLKIKTRMWLGFGAILILVVLLGGVAFWHSGRIWENTDYLYRNPFKVNIAIREIQTHVMGMHRSMKNVAMAETQDELNSAVHQINMEEADVYSLFDTIYSRYLGKRSSVDSAVAAFRDWKLIRDETIRLSQAGKQRDAFLRTKSVGENQVALIMSKINVIRDFALSKAISFYMSAEKGKNQLYLQLLIILIVILVLTFLIMAFIMQGITIPLQGLVDFAEHYGNGRYHVRNQYDSNNEMGVLAASMNRLAENVHFDMTVKNGTMEIADAMLANDDLPTFCRSVLEELLLKTNSNLGAFYFLNEASLMFEPYYSSGFTSGNLKSFSSVANEGEFGAVVAGKKIVTITRIPDDSVFIFSTVAGSIKPKELIVIPVIRQERVIAIVSLASIRNYDLQSLEIIKQSEKNLNMSVNAILAFERVREYANTLDKQNELLNNQAKELTTQTSELLEQNTELEIQKQQIDEANKLKSQFLSSMSHELRTPLNSVIALSGILYKRLKNQIASEEYSYLEIIERNGKNLLSLINDILDLSRIESGKTELQYSTFPLNDVVKNILGSIQVQIKEKMIVVRNLLGPEIPMITSDRDKCHHILQNIIGNAVKFTDSGSVDIMAELIGSEVSVSVKDTGIGIPADQLPHIFDEFRQVDGTSSRQYGGTGLGLAIADKFARKLNARIEVSSEPGKGSVFTVTFPVTATTEGSMQTTAGLSTFYQAHDPLPELKRTAANGKIILVVEDSEPAIVQLSWILKDQGYQVEVARDGFEALAAMKMKIPDAIILDLMMPGMDGFEVLERMRGTRETATIPVLILTAMYLSHAELKRLTENHVHQLVQKGDVNKNDLLSMVRKMLFPYEMREPGDLAVKAPRAKISAPATILIIDDNADNVTTLRVLLQDENSVVTVTDGRDGVDKAKSLKPDLILLDLSLPGMDGFKVFDEIRKEEILRHIPVIAVTAKAMKGDREQILSHGFDDYISKPVEPDVFEETISKWIR